MRKVVITWSLLFCLSSLVATTPVNQISAANLSLPCTTERADKIVKYIKEYEFNATVLVATCRSVCNVVLGTGNPVRSIETCNGEYLS